MRPRFTGPPDFFLAFLAAPFAGAVTAILLAFLISLATDQNGTRPGELLAWSLFAGLYGLPICALFTLVVGGCAAAYVHWRRRVPSLPWALAIGFVVATGAFVLLNALTDPPEPDRIVSELSLFAAACSLPTAWAFWRLGLRGRRLS